MPVHRKATTSPPWRRRFLCCSTFARCGLAGNDVPFPLVSRACCSSPPTQPAGHRPRRHRRHDVLPCQSPCGYFNVADILSHRTCRWFPVGPLRVNNVRGVTQLYCRTRPYPQDRSSPRCGRIRSFGPRARSEEKPPGPAPPVRGDSAPPGTSIVTAPTSSSPSSPAAASEPPSRSRLPDAVRAPITSLGRASESWARRAPDRRLPGASPDLRLFEPRESGRQLLRLANWRRRRLASGYSHRLAPVAL